MKTIILLAIGIFIGWNYKPAFADNLINKSKEILKGAFNYLSSVFNRGEKK